MSIKLTETLAPQGKEKKYDLNKLLESAVPTAAVPTAAVPTAKPNAVATANSNTVPTAAVATVDDAVPTGKYDKLQAAYPEMVKLRLRAGTTALLKAKAKELGFGSVSKLIRAALKDALSHEDFRA